MRFRPCIDIHDGQVKQIVGSTLDTGGVLENFISQQGADHYAKLYKDHELYGGHIIMLNKAGTLQYEASKAQAIKGLRAFPGGMQIGGGIDADTADLFIKEGASHVIVTSFVFKDGRVKEDNLKRLRDTVGKEHIVLDLSCKRYEDKYYIATDRWPKMTEVDITIDNLNYFSDYCDEFLIHAVDVEGKRSGIAEDLIRLLSEYKGLPITYAGGVRSIEDMMLVDELGKGNIDVTVGSALDLFGGDLAVKEAVGYCKRK